jgi:3-hydroxyacyl-[acyl-carrier-protein] dehydratase
MVPSLLFDISGIDLDRVQHGVDAIEKVNPHRGCMRLLDGIIHASEDSKEAIAYHDAKPDAFWTAGHIPGRPIFPGVLQLEAAAQLSSWVTLTAIKQITFLGFVGVDVAKFRGQVVPGDRLIILAKQLELRPRRSIYATQGLVNGKQVFEATITGMPI